MHATALRLSVESTLSFYLGITDRFLQVGEFTNAEPVGPEAYVRSPHHSELTLVLSLAV